MWISILGMYQHDETIFNNMWLPVGLDKETTVKSILFECAELEILYPEIEVLKKAIELWSKSNQYSWQKLYNTMFFDYNPIWNVDANIADHENTTGVTNISAKDNRDITVKGTGQDKETRNMTDTRSVQGFNSSSWSHAEKTDYTGTDTHDLKNESKTDDDLVRTETDTANGKRDYTQRRTGNIGVTTTQHMIQEEREIADFNMIDVIIDSFKKRFCIMVY